MVGLKAGKHEFMSDDILRESILLIDGNRLRMVKLGCRNGSEDQDEGEDFDGGWIEATDHRGSLILGESRRRCAES